MAQMSAIVSAELQTQAWGDPGYTAGNFRLGVTSREVRLGARRRGESWLLSCKMGGCLAHPRTGKEPRVAAGGLCGEAEMVLRSCHGNHRRDREVRGSGKREL